MMKQEQYTQHAIVSELSTLFFLFSRSLAYNNLETLPKDLFKGLEALTKV